MSIFRSVEQDSPPAAPLPSSTPSRFTKRLGALLWLATIAITLWIVAAYLLPQDLRKTRFLYQFAASASFVARVLRFDSSLALGAIALLAIVLRRWRLASLSIVVSSILFWPTLASMLPKSPPPVQGQTVRLMTMNLLFSNQSGDAIVYQIRRANPDVIAMQEYSNWHDELLQHELADYPYRLVAPQPDATGVALYSKLPFHAEIESPHNIMGTRIHIRAQMQIAGRDVVLYAIHPSSPHRYDNILRNRLETADLLDEIRHETLPVIIAGDFNATETTANLDAYTHAGFTSTHDLAGVGRCSTWPDTTLLRRLPGFRIDHILLGSQFTCTTSRVCGPTGSDHRPVVADVGFRMESDQQRS